MQSVTGTNYGFTKLLVWDLEATATFYKAVAGVVELARVEDEIGGRKIAEIMFKPTHEGASTFVLLKFLDAPKPTNDEVIIGFVTDNTDAFVERAVAAGGAVVDPARDIPAHGVRVAFVTDIEGHLIEVAQLLA